MKRILFYALIMLSLFTVNASLLAQQGGGGRRMNMEPEELAERQTNQMKESLKLTDEQLLKVEALNLKYAKKMKAARDEAGEDREAMRNTMMEMVKEKDVELKKILTDDQWTTFEEDRKKRIEQRRGRGGGRRGI